MPASRVPFNWIEMEPVVPSGMLAPPFAPIEDIPYLDLKMVPEVQGGMLAPPFMDHRMTSEFGLTRTNCRTHARHGVKHCSSGNGLRQMI